jgi:hypothetical protein
MAASLARAAVAPPPGSDEVTGGPVVRRSLARLLRQAAHRLAPLPPTTFETAGPREVTVSTDGHSLSVSLRSTDALSLRLVQTPEAAAAIAAVCAIQRPDLFRRSG